MNGGDAPAVLAVYAEGIATGHATFQHEVPEYGDWDKGHLERPRLVAEADGALAGWAALSPVSSRAVYRGVAEVSVYVGQAHRGAGIGAALMASLVRESEAAGLWTLQAGIFPENSSSLALHTAHGFRVIGVRERVGRMRHGPLAGQWRDVILLERRSAIAGTD